MSDFFQDGSVATLHDFGTASLEDTARLITRAGKHITLVLPCHARDIETHAFHHIVHSLKGGTFLDRVIIGLDAATKEESDRLTERCAGLPQDVRVLWNAANGLGNHGKGRNLWLSLGRALALGTDIVVAHDCDIVDYALDIPARLCAAVCGDEFRVSKGYSARFSRQMNGRVTRLLFFPLIQATRMICGDLGVIRFLAAFRYPLSGGFAVHAEVVKHWQFSADWGIEIQLLTEAYRTVRAVEICQVDIADCYDHRHQDLSPNDPACGLNKMAFEVCRCVLETLAGEGIRVDRPLLGVLREAYLQRAKVLHSVYAAEARLNALDYSIGEETQAVTTFAEALARAGEACLVGDEERTRLPAWASELEVKR